MELIGFTGRESHRNEWKILNLRDRESEREEVDFTGLRFVKKVLLCVGITTCVPSSEGA